MKLFTRSVCLTLYTILFSVSAFAVTANFTADVVAGCAPLVVHFTNTSSPMSGTTFAWDLGNGTTSPLTDVSGSYLTPGTYTVKLTATNGSSTNIHTMTITVYPSPTVSFYANDTEICPGSSVTFTSTSTAGVPGPMTYTWGFGDGGSSTGSPVTHTYASSGWYNVTLSVRNADGCVSTLTKAAYIHVYTPATPNFSASSNYFCKAPAHVVFTNLTTGTAPFTYTWRFGDGSAPSTSTSPTHDYTASGSYTVTLIVTDGHGCTDSLVMPGYITVGNLHAAFTFPTTACVNSVITFPNTSSSHISQSWDFGDGHYSSVDPGSNLYSAPGTYTVRLIVYDGFCYDTVTHNITIIPGPATSFTMSPAHACPPPVGILFTGTAPSGSTVTWLYGDGGTGSGTSSAHTYLSTGVDTIRMICSDPATGCRDTIYKIDTIYPLIFTVTATPDHGCKPLTVNFYTTASTIDPFPMFMSHPYPYPITSWTWDFGDGSPTGSGPTPTHVYTAVGTYHALVTGTTSNGCTVTDTVTILVGSPPQVTFTYTPSHLCYHHNQVNFAATIIIGPVDEYVWTFSDGGGETSSTPTVSHVFGLPGVFGATVTPYYHGCPGPPYGLSNIITIDSPKAVPYDSIYCSPHTRVQFRDSSLGDDTHIWIFGDGTTSTLDHPLHDYPGLTTYTVTLATYNIRSGCRDTATVYLNLQRPIPVMHCADTAICRDSIAVLTSTVTGGTASGYWWHSAGISADSTSPTYIDTFHARGIYDVMLVIMDQNGCKDTAIRTGYILVAKPDAHFNVSPPTGCWPLTTTFTDVSTDVPGTFFTNFYWTFGDGGTASVTTPSVTHTFTAAGTYTTDEIVVDNVGCRDTIDQTLVTVYRPHAVFTASNLYPCPILDSTQFLNTSVGIVSSFWIFGDGTTSTAYAPWHTYMLPGVYTVKLVVTDSHGCTDTMIRVSYINVTKPVASFYMDDSVSICPPLMVHFFNTSIGGVSFAWDLGDGTTSTLVAPSDLYTGTGYDTVQLVVTNAYGCRDTVYGHINLFGYAGAFQYTPDSGCAPLSVRFSATTLNVPNIIWDFADGTTSHLSFTDTTWHTYTLPGAYVPKLILSDNTGCQNSSMGIDTIKVDIVYAGFRIIPTPVCLGDTFMLADTSKSYWSIVNSWSWTVDGQTSSIDSPSFFIGVPGTYPATLIATDGWGCSTTIIKDVTIYDLPKVTVSPDTVVCVGDPAILTGYGAATYVWSPAATLSCTACNPTHATPTVITSYTVVGTDIHGCKNWDSTTVFLRTNTISAAGVDTEICQGVVVPLWDTGGTKYTWIPALGLSDPHASHPTATPMQTTKYMVIAQLAGCIPDTNYVLIYVHPLPIVDAGPDQTVLAGTLVQLNATGKFIDKYRWDNPGSLSCDGCANPVATPSVTTKYRIDVTSDFGCRNSDTVVIHVYCDKSQIFVPNSFTPNGDGQNDVFYPRGTGVSSIKSFRVYNRWGELLFERSNIDINDETNAWDGSFKGGTPRPDVYVWVVDAICETGEMINIKGDVTIIR